MSSRGSQNGDPASVFEHIQIRLEHECQSFGRPRQRAASDHGDGQQDEQSRHGHGAEFFNATGHAAYDDEYGEYDIDGAEDQGRYAAVDKGREIGLALRSVDAPARTEDVSDIGQQILEYVAAQDAVKGQQNERGQGRQPAVEGEPLIQPVVRADGRFAALSADGELSDQTWISDDHHHDQVEGQKGKASAVPHLVRESPDVAQAHGGAYGRHQESEVALKLSFVVSAVAGFNLYS